MSQQASGTHADGGQQRYSPQWTNQLHKWSADTTQMLATTHQTYKPYAARNPSLATLNAADTEQFYAEYIEGTRAIKAMRASHLIEALFEETIPDQEEADPQITRGIVVRHCMTNAALMQAGVPSSDRVATFFIPFTQDGSEGLTEEEWAYACTSLPQDTSRMVDLLEAHLETMYAGAGTTCPDEAADVILRSGIQRHVAALIKDPSATQVSVLPMHARDAKKYADIRYGGFALGAALATTALERLSHVTPAQLGIKAQDRTQQELPTDMGIRCTCVTARIDCTGTDACKPGARYVPLHTLSMYMGASHPTKHTLVSYAFTHNGNQPQSGSSAEYFETFAAFPNWREDVLCIPKCAKQMNDRGAIYKDLLGDFRLLCRSTTDWLGENAYEQSIAGNDTRLPSEGIIQLSAQMSDTIEVDHICRKPELKNAFHEEFTDAFGKFIVNIQAHNDEIHTHAIYTLLVPPIKRPLEGIVNSYVAENGFTAPYYESGGVTYAYDPVISTFWSQVRAPVIVVRDPVGTPFTLQYSVGNANGKSAMYNASLRSPAWLKYSEAKVKWLQPLLCTVGNLSQPEPEGSKIMRLTGAFYASRYSIKRDEHSLQPRAFYYRNIHQQGTLPLWSTPAHPHAPRGQMFQRVLPAPGPALGASLAPDAARLPPNPRRAIAGANRPHTGGAPRAMQSIVLELSDIKRFITELALSRAPHGPDVCEFDE